MSERLRALLRRQSSVSEGEGNIIEDLRQGVPLLDVIARRGIPPAAARGIPSFYELLEPTPRACDGTACHFAAGHKPTGATVRCLGRCYAPPATNQTAPPPIPRQALGIPPIVLRHVLGESLVDPRPKPPYPAQAGLYGQPTVVQNNDGGGGPWPNAAWKLAVIGGRSAGSFPRPSLSYRSPTRHCPASAMGVLSCLIKPRRSESSPGTSSTSPARSPVGAALPAASARPCSLSYLTEPHWSAYWRPWNWGASAGLAKASPARFGISWSTFRRSFSHDAS